MYLPKLDREKDKFTVIQSLNKAVLASIIYIYFTMNITHREIEQLILKSDFKGYQVLNVLKYYGLKREHANILRNHSYEDCIKILNENSLFDSQYEAVYQILNSVNHNEILTKLDNSNKTNNYETKSNMNMNLDYSASLKLLSNKEQEAYYNYISKIRNKKIQDNFREKLINEFQEKCALCNVNNPHLLIASHIIPYSMCSSDLNIAGNPNNGLLLCPIHDALFESGNYISFSSEGKIIVTSKIPISNYADFYISDKMIINYQYLNAERKIFLESHRTMFMKKNIKL